MFEFARSFARWPSRAPRVDSLHSMERMRAILDRERMRSDRGKSMFALLTITLGDACGAAQLDCLGQALRDRLRVTDDAGLLGPHCVGVVLPETSVVGAWKLADDVSGLLPNWMPRPQYNVYVHPADRDPAARDLDEAVEPREAADQPADEQLSPAGGIDPRMGEAMQLLFVQAMPLWKRTIDVIGSATALLLLSPLLLLAAIAIKLSSPGPVFFAQLRQGLGGRPFTIYKFRSMCVDAEERKAALRSQSEQDGPAFKIAKDPRVTRIGRILRVTSIDELPQLFNVLWGDMSLVGPRPLPCGESESCLPWQRRRLDVTPGLTCIWQVRGRSKVTFDEWVRMDMRYIRTRSIVTDATLIAQTLPAVVLRRGAC